MAKVINIEVLITVFFSVKCSYFSSNNNLTTKAGNQIHIYSFFALLIKLELVKSKKLGLDFKYNN